VVVLGQPHGAAEIVILPSELIMWTLNGTAPRAVIVCLVALVLSASAATVSIPWTTGTSIQRDANVGDVIEWTWSSGTHNVVEASGCAALQGSLDCATATNTGTCQYTVVTADEGRNLCFKCGLHASMTASINVADIPGDGSGDSEADSNNKFTAYQSDVMNQGCTSGPDTTEEVTCFGKATLTYTEYSLDILGMQSCSKYYYASCTDYGTDCPSDATSSSDCASSGMGPSNICDKEDTTTEPKEKYTCCETDRCNAVQNAVCTTGTLCSTGGSSGVGGVATTAVVCVLSTLVGILKA